MDWITTFDVSGDEIFNSLDILIILFNVLFWRTFYKQVVKSTIDYKKELSDTDVVYVNAKGIVKELDKFQNQLDKQ